METPEKLVDESALNFAVFQVVRPGNAYEETIERLLKLIKLGIVPLGDRLPPERELATQLGVSRVTLREAIRSLSHAGYLESRRGHAGGTFVRYRPEIGAPPSAGSPSAAEVEDALTFRSVVEPAAMELVASRRLSPTQRAVLTDRLTEVDAAPMETYRQADSRFHLTLAELSGSVMVTRAIAEARMALNDLLNALPPLQPPIDHANRQHAELVAAVLANDGVRARRVMQRHIEATAALLRGFLT